jgi:hypothetical protein
MAAYLYANVNYTDPRCCGQFYPTFDGAVRGIQRLLDQRYAAVLREDTVVVISQMLNRAG